MKTVEDYTAFINSESHPDISKSFQDFIKREGGRVSRVYKEKMDALLDKTEI